MAIFDNPVFMVLIVFIGMIAFAMTAFTIMGYRQNSPQILKMLKMPFLRIWIVQEDYSIKKYVIKVKQLEEGSTGQKSFHISKREYLLKGESILREGSEPLRLYFWDNPYPVTFKQFVEKRIVIGQQKHEVQDLFMTTHRTSMDSEELYDAVHNKVVRMMFNIPSDQIKMLTFIIALGALVASVGLYTQLIEIKDGMVYDNQIIEKIAQDHDVELPLTKPRIFASQNNNPVQVKNP